jgi:hypothetical protein
MPAMETTVFSVGASKMRLTVAYSSGQLAAGVPGRREDHLDGILAIQYLVAEALRATVDGIAQIAGQAHGPHVVSFTSAVLEPSKM